MPLWSDLADFYETRIFERGKQPLFLALVAFIVGFAFIRLSTRMIRAQVSWWPGNVRPGGLHIHHVVFGTVFMLVGGVGSFSTIGNTRPWADILACVFGVGAALVLDEFALILHLEDVYWSAEGRKSVDAVILGAALTGMVVLGASPLGVADAHSTSWWGVVLPLLENAVLVVITFAKGKLWVGTIGILFPVVTLFGALRLARPASPWAHWRYPPGSRKLARAQARERRVNERMTSFRHRVIDTIAGSPDPPAPLPPPEH